MDRCTAQAILDDLAAQKQAGALEAAEQQAASALQGEALSDIANVAMLSGGIGMGARGAMGIYNLLRRNLRPAIKPESVATIPLPFPEEPAEEKTAANEVPTDKMHFPWYMPGIWLSGIAGGYGGWKAVDSLLDARRRQAAEDDVTQAKRDFETALLSQYDKPVKLAADDPWVKVGQELDQLADQFEKAAGVVDSAVDAITPSANTMSTLGNYYTMYAAPSALLAGYAVYNATKKRRRREVLSKAIDARRRRRQEQAPLEIYATPQPVLSPAPGAAP